MIWKAGKTAMKKWILRIFKAIVIVSVLTGTFFICKGYCMFQNALEECSLTDKVRSIRASEAFVPWRTTRPWKNFQRCILTL